MHDCAFISNHNSALFTFVEHCYTLINNAKGNIHLWKWADYLWTSKSLFYFRIEPSANAANRFFSFICWQLLGFVFGAFGMLQVPQKVIFFRTKAPTHLPIINILLNEE